LTIARPGWLEDAVWSGAELVYAEGGIGRGGRDVLVHRQRDRHSGGVLLGRPLYLMGWPCGVEYAWGPS
jgi:hypothetical protein